MWSRAVGEDDFTCAICRRPVCMRWSMGRRFDPLPPICRSCEHGYGGNGRGQSGGSFRDRREVVRGIALAEALRTEALTMQWGRCHAAA